MKVWNYVIAILGVLVLLDFAGLHTDKQGILSLFGFAKDPVTLLVTFDPSFSSVFNFLFSNVAQLGFGILLGIGAAGIAVGTIAKGRLENFIILPLITTTLVLFVSAINDIVNIGLGGGSIPAWIGYVIAFVGVILAGGLIIALPEFFRGTD